MPARPARMRLTDLVACCSMLRGRASERSAPLVFVAHLTSRARCPGRLPRLRSGEWQQHKQAGPSATVSAPNRNEAKSRRARTRSKRTPDARRRRVRAHNKGTLREPWLRGRLAASLTASDQSDTVLDSLKKRPPHFPTHTFPTLEHSQGKRTHTKGCSWRREHALVCVNIYHIYLAPYCICYFFNQYLSGTLPYLLFFNQYLSGTFLTVAINKIVGRLPFAINSKATLPRK